MLKELTSYCRCQTITGKPVVTYIYCNGSYRPLCFGLGLCLLFTLQKLIGIFVLHVSKKTAFR